MAVQALNEAGFLTFPKPDDHKLAGGYELKNSGVGASAVRSFLGVKVTFTSKAVSGGDLAAFASIKLPANGTLPGQKAKSTTIKINLKDGATAAHSAKALAAAIKKAGVLYAATVSGNTVTVQPDLMLPRTAAQ